MATTTCQICGRAVLAKTGLIAHHGYKRPGNGWQTSSCYGARYRPYEVARDAIEGAISQCEGFIARTETTIAAMQANPPVELTEVRKSGWKTNTTTLARPEGFNPSAPSPGSYRPGSADHYACLFHGRQRARRAQVTAAHADIAFMAARFDAWVAPQGED